MIGKLFKFVLGALSLYVIDLLLRLLQVVLQKPSFERMKVKTMTVYSVDYLL